MRRAGSFREADLRVGRPDPRPGFRTEPGLFFVPMKAYIVTSSEDHDKPIGFGIFTSMELAEAAVMKCPTAGTIHAVEIDVLHQEEGNTHITPTMKGVEIRECDSTEGAFQIG